MKLHSLRPALLLLAALGMGTSARAEMVLSQVIVDLEADEPPRDDIEVWNSGTDRMYVQAEPFEIVSPGSAREARVAASDPETSGILISPQRLVLAPGERRIIRIALLGGRPSSDRVYRVAIRPVVGALSAPGNAVKVLVGYDALVIVRPEQRSGDIVGHRDGNTLVLRNEGNTSQEIYQGRQCDAAGDDCRELPAKRLYPGASWVQALPFDTPVSYKTAIADQIRERQF